jgi:clan AA aspartic protease
VGLAVRWYGLAVGETYVKVRVGAPAAPVQRGASVRLLIDTGATLPVVPARILRALRVPVVDRARVLLADGRVVRRRVGEARLELDGHRLTSRVLFGEKGDAPVLGTTVLEQLGLAVDPVRRRLVPVTLLLV